MSSSLKYGGYPRISEDPNDLRHGTTRQREDITAGIVARGGDPDEIHWYDENDTSAYKKRRVTKVDGLGNEYIGYRVIRPKWQRALADLRTGVIDVLVVYDLDRLARDPRDLEDAIEVVQYYGKRIEGFIPGKIDLTTDDGITMARVMVAMNSKSSADTGRRVARAHLSLAAEGVPVGGGRPFGWLDDKATLHPEEAPVMQEIIAKVVAGESIRSGVARLKAEGFMTTRGLEWKSQTLTQYLRNPRLVGHRTHKGTAVRNEEGQVVHGKWEPLVDEDTWDRLQIIMRRNTEGIRKGRKNARQYLLTGILRCTICNGHLYGDKNMKNGVSKPRYACTQSSDGHSNTIIGAPVERLVHDLVVGKLEQDAISAPPPPAWGGAHQIAELETTIAATLAQLGKGKIAPERIFGQVERMEKELAELNAERAQWLDETVGPSTTETTPEEYLTEGMEFQRAMIEKYFSAIYVMPQIKPQKRFDPERVVPAWRTAG